MRPTPDRSETFGLWHLPHPGAPSCTPPPQPLRAVTIKDPETLSSDSRHPVHPSQALTALLNHQKPPPPFKTHPENLSFNPKALGLLPLPCALNPDLSAGNIPLDYTPACSPQLPSRARGPSHPILVSEAEQPTRRFLSLFSHFEALNPPSCIETYIPGV